MQGKSVTKLERIVECKNVLNVCLCFLGPKVDVLKSITEDFSSARYAICESRSTSTYNYETNFPFCRLKGTRQCTLRVHDGGKRENAGFCSAYATGAPQTRIKWEGRTYTPRWKIEVIGSTICAEAMAGISSDALHSGMSGWWRANGPGPRQRSALCWSTTGWPWLVSGDLPALRLKLPKFSSAAK